MKGTRRDEREGCPESRTWVLIPTPLELIPTLLELIPTPLEPPTFHLPAQLQGGQKGTTARRSGWW